MVKNLTEAEEIKRGQEYTEELYKKVLNDHDGVIIHLEPDNLKCEVKWALERITTKKKKKKNPVEVTGFQLIYFKC